MGEVHCRDNRTGIIYVYESHSYWDKTEKKTKAKRKLIGRLDENGKVVPTSGHPGRPRKNPLPPPSTMDEDEEDAFKAMERTLQTRIDSLTKANAELAKEVRETKRRQTELLSALQSVIQRFSEG